MCACAYIHVCVPEWKVPGLVICRILWSECWTSSSRIIWSYGSFVDGSWNLCDDVMHTFHANTKVFTDMPKHYTTIMLHHLVHFGTCVWVCNVGWTPGVCQVLSAAPSLFEPLAPVKHCCTLQTVVTVHVLHSRMNEWMNEWMLVLHLLRIESGWCSVLCAWMNPWLYSTEQLAVVQRSHRAACLWCVAIMFSSDHCQTAQVWLTLHTYNQTVHIVYLFIKWPLCRQPILVMGMSAGFCVFRSLRHAAMLLVILSSYG